MRGEAAIKDKRAAFKFKDIRSAFTLKYNGKVPQWNEKCVLILDAINRLTALKITYNLHSLNMKEKNWKTVNDPTKR